MREWNTRRGGVLCVQQADGSYSDTAIHEAIMDGVDDSDFRAQTRAKLRARGTPPEVLQSLFSSLPPDA
jgi:hypothetical protein